MPKAELTLATSERIPEKDFELGIRIVVDKKCRLGMYVLYHGCQSSIGDSFVLLGILNQIVQNDPEGDYVLVVNPADWEDVKESFNTFEDGEN